MTTFAGDKLAPIVIIGDPDAVPFDASRVDDLHIEAACKMAGAENAGKFTVAGAIRGAESTIIPDDETGTSEILRGVAALLSEAENRRPYATYDVQSPLFAARILIETGVKLPPLSNEPGAIGGLTAKQVRQITTIGKAYKNIVESLNTDGKDEQATEPCS